MHDENAKRELSNMLVTHRKYVGGEFSLVSLIDSLGHDGRDWSELALGDLYAYWLSQYLPKHGKVAYGMAHATAAHRAGALLKQVLEKKFSGLYVVVGRKGVGRFGGPLHYRWLSA